MIIRWRRLLLHDIGRKGAALLMAVFAWTQVNDAVSDVDTLELSVILLDADQPTAGPGQLGIAVPPGYILTSPAPYQTSLVFTFHGPRAVISDFLPTLSATYRPTIVGSPTSPRVQVSPEDFEWNLQSEFEQFFEGVLPAGAVLKNEPDLDDVRAVTSMEITLQFEREKIEAVDLSLSSVVAFKPNGEPAEGYELPSVAVTITPTNVRLIGPNAAVVDYLGAVTDGSQTVLEDLDLAGRKRPFSKSLRIAPALAAAGLRLDPETVNVHCDVRLTSRLEFQPDMPHLLGSTADGSQWEITEWNPGPWIASFAQRVGDLALDRSFAQDHIMLFIDVGRIPDGVGDSYRATVQWLPVGVSADKWLDILNTLRLEPLNGDDWIVTLRKEEETAPDTSDSESGD